MKTNLDEKFQLPLPLSRDQRRSKRPDRPRSKSVSVYRMSRAELDRGRQEYPEETKHLRPRTRADCKDAPRPCPFVSCKHHLYLDVSPRTGAIKMNFPDIDGPEEFLECLGHCARASLVAKLVRWFFRKLHWKSLFLVHFSPVFCSIPVCHPAVSIAFFFRFGLELLLVPQPLVLVVFCKAFLQFCG